MQSRAPFPPSGSSSSRTAIPQYLPSRSPGELRPCMEHTDDAPPWPLTLCTIIATVSSLVPMQIRRHHHPSVRCRLTTPSRYLCHQEPHSKLRPSVGHKEHMYLDPGSPPFTLPPSHPSPFVHSHEPPPPSDVVEPPPNLHPCLGAVSRGEKPLKSFPMLRLTFHHRELLAVARNSAAVALGRRAHP